MEKKITSHLNKGLIIGLVLVAIGIVFQVMDIYERWLQWLILGLFCIAIIWACISYASEMEGNVTFGKVFSHGFKTSAVVAIIAIVSFILMYYIMPETKAKIIEKTREELAKNPQMTDEIIESTTSMMDKSYFLFGIIGSIFSYAFIGAIASLIGAGFAKKNPNNNMPQSM